MGNYHLNGVRPVPERVVDRGSNADLAVPAVSPNPLTHDVDGDSRLRSGANPVDIGADELRPATANLQITKSDGVSRVTAGGSTTYTITVSNLGPDAASGAVVDNFPASLSGVLWSCAASSGSSCAVGAGTGNINTSVTLANGGSATFTAIASVTAAPTGAIVNTASVAVGGTTSDPVAANNSATDTDFVVVALVGPPLLDGFNRANALNLGSSWSQASLFGLAAITVNASQASAPLLGGQAIWNGVGSTFGAKQGAAFTVVNPTGTVSLFLKGSGGSAASPQNYLRVQLDVAAGTVTVASTTNSGGSFTARGTVAGVSFAAGDKLTAVAAADGSVTVYQSSGAVTTLLLTSAAAPVPFTGSGRVGMSLSAGARVDDFSGGTMP
jgi:uncharacterized repeat protein (TIGR01451 family)